MMELLTRRFLLRDFTDDDAPAFEAYHRNPRSLDFYNPEDSKPEHARELIKIFMAWAKERPRLNYQLAIIRRSAPCALVGCCGLRSAGSDPGKAELGIELAPEHWGKYGYAIEVMQALVEFGFDILGLQAIHGNTNSANSRIVRLVNSFGATEVTRMTPAWMSAKGWSQVEWQITREQWKSGRLTNSYGRRINVRKIIKNQ